MDRMLSDYNQTLQSTKDRRFKALADLTPEMIEEYTKAVEQATTPTVVVKIPEHPSTQNLGHFQAIRQAIENGLVNWRI
jgi:hypothetical protein